jgi:small-conductance mechanosensitive channel
MRFAVPRNAPTIWRSSSKPAREPTKKAKKDAAAIEDLRQRLQAAEDALSDKEAKQVERKNEISTRLKTQSRRFLINAIFLFCRSTFSLC